MRQELFKLSLIFFIFVGATSAQQRISSPVGPPENWVRPFEGFQIIENL